MRHLSFYSFALVLVVIPLKNTLAYSYNEPTVQRDAALSIEDTLQNDDLQQDIKLLRCAKCWFVSAGVGAASTTAQDASNNLDNGSGFPAPANVDQYLSNQDNSWGALFSADFGYRFLTQKTWSKAVSIGLRYRFLLNNETTGDVIEQSNPTSFNNYDFTLSSDSNVLTAFAKINIANFGHFSPYVSAGIGLDVNTTNYSESADAGVSARTSPSFGNKTNVGLACELGAGVDYYLRRLLILSVGYDYLYLGASAATGNGTVDWSSSSLNFGSQSANTLLFRTTYIFNA